MSVYTEDTLFGSRMNHLTTKYLALWRETSDAIPRLATHFSHRQKLSRERELDHLLDRLPESTGSIQRLDSQIHAEVSHKARSVILRFLGDGRNDHFRKFFSDCEVAGKSFVQEAREFDRSLSENDIHQALRNLWVFNSIQLYLGRPVVLTPSSFAYSLLYPYTDNWLDAPHRTREAKGLLLRWLTWRLEESASLAGHPPSAEIAHLLDIIEQEFPRRQYPDVFRGLLAIHRAQEASLRLHTPATNDDDESQLAITFLKGGTSVLADGYLVWGNVDQTQGDALFGYGVLLQLIDDLRDLDEDIAAAQSSPFSRVASERTLDAITNRLLNFLALVVAGMSGGRESANYGLGDLIERSCTVLIQEAVAQYQTYYSGGYVQRVEESTPVRFSYLSRLRERLKKNGTSGGGGVFCGPVIGRQDPHMGGVVR